MPHILHSLCHLILTIILCPQCSSLKLRLREVMPQPKVTQVVFLAYTVVARLRFVKRPLAAPCGEQVQGSPVRARSPASSALPASLWLSGSPTHDVGPRFPRCWCPWFIFRSRVHASLTRRLLAGPRALLREPELPVKEVHCAPCQ